MKFSRFNFLIESSRFGFLLYNSYSNSFMTLEEDLYHSLLKSKDDHNEIEKIDSDVKEDLVLAKVFVDENQDAEVLNELRYRYYLNSYERNSLMLTVAPTLDCNFDCFYCYENNKEQFFSRETEADFINFLKKFDEVKNLSITWYGGEPLMKFDSIRRCWDSIKELHFGEQRHSIVTNGYLLSEEISQYFAENPLSTIQITIDGDEERHNKRRRLKNGGGSYKTIKKI